VPAYGIYENISMLIHCIRFYNYETELEIIKESMAWESE